MVSRIVARRPRALSRQRGYLGVGNRRVLGGSGAQTFAQFWSSPSFWAQLTTSIVPDHAAPGTAATFTRATTATVTDWEGIVRPVLSGEVRFQGARRVRNLAANTENLTGAPWGSVSGGTGSVATCTAGFTAPDGTSTAFRVQANRGAGTTAADQSGWNDGGFSSVSGQQIRQSMWLKSNTGGNQNVAIRLTGVNAAAVVTVTPQWQRLTEAAPNLSSGGGYSAAFIGTRATFGDQVLDVLVWHPQVEDVAGASNQNPSEYVSVGVLATPFQGAGVDGVQYFATQNGNTVTSNVVTAGTGAAIASATLLGYLAEEQRTNLCLFSRDLSNAAWVKTGATIGGSTVLVDGTTGTVNKILEDTTTGLHGTKQAFTKAASALAYTGTFDLKQAERTWALVQILDGANGAQAWVNLATGALGTVSNFGAGFASTSAAVTAAPNGFWRLSLTTTSSTSTVLQYAVYSATGDSVSSFAGTLNSGIFCDFAGLEQASFAASRIPTTAVAVTRNADVLTYPNAGNMGGTQGACYAEATSNGTAGTVAMFVGTDTNGRLLESSAVTNIRAIDNGATNIAIKTLLANWAIAGASPKKVASTWGGTTLKVTSEGQSPAAGASFTSMSTANPICVGNLTGGSNSINGTIRNVKIWKSAAPDAYLTQATAP